MFIKKQESFPFLIFKENKRDFKSHYGIYHWISAQNTKGETRQCALPALHVKKKILL